MNKKIKVIISCLVIIIILLLITVTFMYLNNTNNYTSRKTIQTTIKSNSINEEFTANNSITLEDLSVNLAKIGYYPDGNDFMAEKNVLEFTLNFISKNQDIKSIQYDYIIFDENNKILSTSLWDNIENNKRYMKGLAKEKYGESNITKITDNSIYNSKAEHNNITNDLKNYSQTLTSSLNEDFNNPKQINIKIINLKYKLVSTEEKTLENTDLEFVLNFE